eukprot:SAG31_NODE_4327_length_3353_cov_4.742778_5_plen_59_part_00
MGDVVAEGEEVVVVESIKMQHVLRAPRSGVIKAVHCPVGRSVGGNEILIEFETENLQD